MVMMPPTIQNILLPKCNWVFIRAGVGLLWIACYMYVVLINNFTQNIVSIRRRCRRWRAMIDAFEQVTAAPSLKEFLAPL
eukprot:SAG31_NODE_16460_length_708_cov_1.087028_1_plen_79_part_10